VVIGDKRFRFHYADNSAIIISSRIIEEERNSIVNQFVVSWLLATYASISASVLQIILPSSSAVGSEKKHATTKTATVLSVLICWLLTGFFWIAS